MLCIPPMYARSGEMRLAMFTVLRIAYWQTVICAGCRTLVTASLADIHSMLTELVYLLKAVYRHLNSD